MTESEAQKIGEEVAKEYWNSQECIVESVRDAILRHQPAPEPTKIDVEAVAKSISEEWYSECDLSGREALENVARNVLNKALRPPEPVKVKTRGVSAAVEAVEYHVHGLLFKSANPQNHFILCIDKHSHCNNEVVGNLRQWLASLIDSEIAREREECAAILDPHVNGAVRASAIASMIRGRK